MRRMQAVGAKSGAVPSSLATDGLNILRWRPNIGRPLQNRVQSVTCKVTPRLSFISPYEAFSYVYCSRHSRMQGMTRAYGD